MENDFKRYQVIVSDEATQMLLEHARYLGRKGKNPPYFNGEMN